MSVPVAELDDRLQPFLQEVFSTPYVEPLTACPSLVRDMGIVVQETVTHEDVVNAVWKIASKELTRIELFDIYHTQELGMDRKSMAYSLTYCSLDRTLTDAEVNALHTAIKAGIRNELQAKIREG